jgi:hypothetical protein
LRFSNKILYLLIKKKNRALLGKWSWCYEIESEDWWGVAVDSKFGSLWGGVVEEYQEMMGDILRVL